MITISNKKVKKTKMCMTCLLTVVCFLNTALGKLLIIAADPKRKKSTVNDHM